MGRFFVQNFAPEDYGAHPQNWSVAQGSDDLIYVGNGEGILEYDGVAWRRIPISNNSIVRSLVTGDEGRIFVGAVGELGFLAPDPQGKTRYVSLVEKIPKGDRGFADVWRMASTSGGVYFQTRERLFRWDGQRIRVWRAETGFLACYSLGDVLLLWQKGAGLMTIDGDSLVPAPGGDFFQDKLVFGLVPWGSGESLVVTEADGMFRCHRERFSEEACSPFGPESTDLLASLRPHYAAAIPEGFLVVATLRGGGLVFDASGRLVRTLGEDSGLRNGRVWFPHVDRQGGLWLGLDNGIARVEARTGLSFWDEDLGLEGGGVDIERHRGRLHVATSVGVYALTPRTGETPTFEPVLDLGELCFSLASTPQGLLAGCNSGLYDVGSRQRLGVTEKVAVFKVFPSEDDPTTVYLGHKDGLSRIHWTGGRWSAAEHLVDVLSGVLNMAEDDRGHLWLSTWTDGVLRFEPGDDDGTGGSDDEPVVTRFGEAEGLPAGRTEVRPIAGRMRVWMEEGLFELGEGAEATRFVPDSTFDAFAPRGSGQELREDNQGRVWISAGEHSGVAIPDGTGDYSWRSTGLRRAPSADVFRIAIDPDGTLWLGGAHGLVRYETHHFLDDDDDFSAKVRRVTTPSGSLIYDGRPAQSPAELLHRDNALRFAFAAPRYDAPAQNQYRVRLDGLDDDWSTWTHEVDKDYTNLWEGRYVFRVQARDVYGSVSEEDRFSFQISPPWWRTWWAYGTYLLMACGALRASYRAAYQGQQRKLEAEQRVNRQLRQVDKLKDEFLAATSHELRTPLYGITGLAESLAEGTQGDLPAAVRRDLGMIVSSGRRLSSLVDDILDVSKLRRSSLVLNRQPVELHALVDIVLTLSRPLVGDQPLELVNAVHTELPLVSADENRLQQVLHNLIGNAIKFTETGSIEVRARVDGDQIVIEIADTGIGIDGQYRSRIFDAFVQADSSNDRHFGGVGLGLAVSRQLVELHGGELWLEASSPEGSTFAFTLPTASEQGAERLTPLPAVEPPIRRSDEANSMTMNGDRIGTSSPPPRPVTPEPASILVVDDEPVNRRVLANHLQAVGYRIALAADGSEALRQVEEQHFDLVLLDIMMPRMSGYEVCRELRQRYPAQDLPVLFLTAKARVEDQAMGLAEGANDYLTKPVPRDTLLARVRTHVDLLTAYRNQLAGLLPICAQCKKVRDDKGYWDHIESFLSTRSDLAFSHGICPPCTEIFLAELRAEAED